MPGPFAPAFLAGEPRTEPFLRRSFAQQATRLEAVRVAAARRTPGEVIEVLRRQQRAYAPSAARERNLGALAEGGCAAVLTGQQVGLFLGPLYTFYKAASAIAVARALAAESGRPCVPIFWLQTEDHDFAEIDHCHALDAEGGLCALNLEAGGVERQSVEHRLLGPSVTGLLERLRGCLSARPHAAEVLALLEQHYRPEASVAGAFAQVIAALFADEGLLVLDPRDPSIARQVVGIHAKALADAAEISEQLLARERALEAAGFDPQVKARPGCPLTFFHPDGAEGPRFRLTPQGDGWSLSGREQMISSTTLAQAIAAQPLQVSSSALLRPVIQDSLLPTAALVGGPGELGYFAQLEPLYRHFGLPMPMAVLRARFRLLDPRTRGLLETLHLGAAEVEASREQLLRKVTGPQVGGRPEALEQQLVGAVDQVLGGLPGALGEDVTDAVNRTRKTVERAASKLAQRYRRSLEGREQVASQRVDRLQRVLFPDGAPQERVLGAATFAAQVGWQGLKEALFAQLEPFGTSIKEVAL